MKRLQQQQSLYQRGQAMMVLLVVLLVVSTTAVLGSLTPTVRAAGIARILHESKASYFLAESGVEDAIHRLKHGIEISASETMTLGDTTVTTNIVSGGSGAYILESIGDTNTHQRKINANIVTADGYSFSYGIQVGAGGFYLDQSAGVIGNVYANGPVIGENNSYITGTVISAGASGLIDGVDDIGSDGEGDAFAHTVTGVSVAGDLYCQVGTSNNKSCDTSREDPPLRDFPYSEDDITEWKARASEGTTITGDHTLSGEVSIGPAVITGDLLLGTNAEVTITGTIWVQGNILTQTNASVALSSSYGENGEIIIVDGYTELFNNVNFAGSGTEGSYLMLASTSDCDGGVSCGGNYAVELENNVGTVIITAIYGTVFFSNNAGAVSATAETIALDNNAEIVYEQGLIDVNFDSGPSGTFTIDGWSEAAE